jgi:hypothetical protein
VQRIRPLQFDFLESRNLLTVSWSVAFNDPSGVYSDFYVPIRDTLLAAANEWGGYFHLSNASIELGVDFTASSRSGGSSETTAYVKKNGALNVFEQSVAHEIRTGNDPNGGTRDGHITLNATYLRDELWFDSTPLDRSDDVAPASKTDAYSVMLHELGHILGFNGWRDYTTGALPGDYQSTFDELVTIDGSGTPFFNGATAMAAYGNQPIPLTYSNLMHFGNDTAGAINGTGVGHPGDDLVGDLMNGIVFYRGRRYEISSLDAAVLQDLGLPISPPNQAPSFLAGGNVSAVAEEGAKIVENWATGTTPGPVSEVGQSVHFIIVSNSASGLFSVPPSVDSQGNLTFTPHPNAHGTAHISLKLLDNGGTANGGVNASGEQGFEIVITKQHPLFNAAESGERRGLDVTGSTSAEPDGFIVSGDVLAVINYINAKGSGEIPEEGPFGPPYVDVNGDNQVVAEDVLKIINWINANPGQSEAEANSTVAFPTSTTIPDDLFLLLATDLATITTQARRAGRK